MESTGRDVPVGSDHQPEGGPAPITGGPADLTYGAAPGGAERPGLPASPQVHGAEGGGDPAAGAVEDSAFTAEAHIERPRGLTP